MIDPFDSLLNQLASVLTRDTATGDAYGLSDPAFTTIATGVPCRVSSGSVGIDKELMAGSKEDIAFKKVFMRPWFDGSGNPLTHDHWLLITVSSKAPTPDFPNIEGTRDGASPGYFLNIEGLPDDPVPIPGNFLNIEGSPDDPALIQPGVTNMYDIFEVRDPGGMGHHLEVVCRLVEP